MFQSYDARTRRPVIQNVSHIRHDLVCYLTYTQTRACTFLPIKIKTPRHPVARCGGGGGSACCLRCNGRAPVSITRITTEGERRHRTTTRAIASQRQGCRQPATTTRGNAAKKLTDGPEVRTPLKTSVFHMGRSSPADGFTVPHKYHCPQYVRQARPASTSFLSLIQDSMDSTETGMSSIIKPYIFLLFSLCQRNCPTQNNFETDGFY
jgi:hypothetical protein